MSLQRFMESQTQRMISHPLRLEALRSDLDDASQHQNDDEGQRHSEQPEKDRHVGLRVHGRN
jgi:hypothetical protein